MRTYRPVSEMRLALGTATPVAALLFALLAAGNAPAQVALRPAAANPAFAEQEVARQVRESTAPLYERLPLEAEFVAAVCGLNERRAAALGDDGRRGIERLADEAASTMRKYQRFNRIQIVVRANGAPAVVPWGGAAQSSDWPRLVTRSILAEVLKARSRPGGREQEIAAWREAADLLAAEQRRLAGLRAAAGALAKVAALDETLRLTSGQRAELCAAFARYAGDHSSNALSVITAGHREQLFTSLAGASLNASRLPASDWRRILSPAQLATYNEMLTPHQEEVAVIGKKEPRGELRAGQKRQVRQMRMEERQLRARAVWRGPSQDFLLRHLTNRLQQHLDEVDAACPLEPEQRAKLLLAGKLDVERLRPRFSAPRLAEDEEIKVAKVQVAGDEALQPYFSAFDDERSSFQKALKGRLSDEQKQKLAAADAQRRAFHRQALMAATVAGFERAASLTSQQWERLSAALKIAVALDDLWRLLGDEQGWNQGNWRDDVARIAQWPQEWWRPFFFDFQWGAARQRHAQLVDAVGAFKMRQRQNEAAPPPREAPAVRIMGEGMF